MNDRGKSRRPLSWKVKDTTGPRNAYVLASRTLFRIIGKCDAARKWKSAAAPRNKPPTVSDRAAMESRWSGVPICASCVTLGSDGTVRPVSSPGESYCIQKISVLDAMRTWAEAEHSFLPPLPEKWVLDRRCPVTRLTRSYAK